MVSDRKGLAIVIMGVSGSGKSTIGKILADAMGSVFLDADDFHPHGNIEKMRQGIPLAEEDRIPWLEILRDKISIYILHGHIVIVSCSALQRKYRDILRSADPNYKSSQRSCVRFVCLDAPAETFASRLEKRASEGTHFMPSSLLSSQLALLQIEEDEAILMIDATVLPHVIVADIQHKLLPLIGPVHTVHG